MQETSDELFYLKWNNFQKNVRRMRDEDGLMDITFACEGKKLGAHKLILFASSPYFKDLLKENSSSHPIFYMNDVKFDILKAILEYMYLGEVHITNENLKDFIRTAEALQIRGLSKDTNTTEDNLLGNTHDNTTDSINIDEDFGRKRQSLDEIGQISNFGSTKRLKCETSATIIDEDLEEEEEDVIEEEEIEIPRTRKEMIRTTHNSLQLIDQQDVEPKVEMLEYLEDTHQKTQQIQLQSQQLQQQSAQQQQQQSQNQQIQYCSMDSYTAAAANNEKTINSRLPGTNDQTQYIQPGTSQQAIVGEYKSEDEVWIDKATMDIDESANSSQTDNSPKSSKSKNSASSNKANCLTPRSCPVCARVYSNVSNLRQHMRLIHNPTAVCCPICQKHFNSDLYLKRHYASIHAINTTTSGSAENSSEIENKNAMPQNPQAWTYTTTNDNSMIQQ